MNLTLTVNGEAISCDIPPGTTLLQVLREELGQTGTKQGCGRGHCGACTVLLDGEPVNACLVLAPAAHGKAVETIDNRTPDRVVRALQAAFVQQGAVQCGFCTPGMVLTSTALLRENPHPGRGEILEALSGNLCRCTGYERIVAAVDDAALALSGQPGTSE